tara:strand:+ start:456 stop:1100 length:645 start_codon:yes stop_codon:yes gene_type:complete
MKIKIKKKGKVKEFKLIKSWNDVTLETWLKLIEFQSGTKTEEAEKTIETLSTIPKELIKQLELRDVVAILSKISELQEKQYGSLKRIIEIEGKRYGFHPDLNEMTLGEFADIETFIKNDLEKSLPELMAVLYRPIVEETEKGVYTIEAYDGKITIRAEQMKKMAAAEVQSALVFFYHFASVLLMTFPSSLTQQQKETTQQSQTNLLQKNGGTLD